MECLHWSSVCQWNQEKCRADGQAQWDLQKGVNIEMLTHDIEEQKNVV